MKKFTISKDYNKNDKLYEKLVKELYEKYPDGVTFPPEYADFTENNLLSLLVRLSRYKFIARIIKKTDRILEVGCGTGLGTSFLGQNCKEIIGLDLKQHEIDEAKGFIKRENVKFQVGDFFSFSESEMFDAVVNMDVIEHMQEDIGNKLVKKASKVLSSNGLFICGTPSNYSYPYQGALSQASHIKCYDRDELEELMNQHFGRCMIFSMNDELVHTGYHKMAWYYIAVAFYPK